jgi:hypothetical protein
VGTFHSDKGELHGITVVVHARGGRTWVGRCDTIDAQGVHLLDADLHAAAADAPPREAWLEQAAAYGVWPRHPRVLVPASEVEGVERLGNLGRGAPGGLR